MTSKFREALDETIDMEQGNEFAYMYWYQDYKETIRQALLIAERLESGDGSPQIYEQIYKANIKADDIDLQPHGEIVFKAMAKVMIEEVCGDN